MRTERDRGYALVAAVTAVAAFAYIAFQVLAVDQGVIAAAHARQAHDRLAAAADAGVMIALHGLAISDPGERWTIDGVPRSADFDGVDLTIAVEDERGKAPLVGLDDDQARVLFEGGGASGQRLDALVGEFHDWRDAGLTDSGPDAGQQRFHAVGELMALKDMDLDLYDRIAPSVTVFFEPGQHFDPKYATPLAIAVMRALGGPNLPATAEPFAQEQPDEEIVTDDRLIGRTLSVHVLARDASGGQARRTAVVELTGDKSQPYWIRYEN
jgi:general secretion pathway protein K